MIDFSIFNNIPIFYISPDIKRALGLELVLPNYYIVCSFYNPLVDMVRKRGGKVFCLEESEKDAVYQIKNSGQLLGHPKVLEFIQNKSKGQTPGILAFKPNLKIDILCSQYGFKKLINSSEINEKFENKINFFEITKKYFPDFHLKGTVGNLGDLNFKVMEKELSLPFVVQFGHGWAGKTTFFIKNELDWYLGSKYVTIMPLQG